MGASIREKNRVLDVKKGTIDPVIMQKHAFWDWFWIFNVEFDDNLTYIKTLHTELYLNRPRGILQHEKSWKNWFWYWPKTV